MNKAQQIRNNHLILIIVNQCWQYKSHFQPDNRKPDNSSFYEQVKSITHCSIVLSVMFARLCMTSSSAQPGLISFITSLIPSWTTGQKYNKDSTLLSVCVSCIDLSADLACDSEMPDVAFLFFCFCSIDTNFWAILAIIILISQFDHSQYTAYCVFGWTQVVFVCHAGRR